MILFLEESKFNFKRLVGVAGLVPTFQTSRQIIRMNEPLPPLTNDLLKGTAEILEHPFTQREGEYGGFRFPSLSTTGWRLPEEAEVRMAVTSSRTPTRRTGKSFVPIPRSKLLVLSMGSDAEAVPEAEIS